MHILIALLLLGILFVCVMIAEQLFAGQILRAIRRGAWIAFYLACVSGSAVILANWDQARDYFQSDATALVRHYAPQNNNDP